MRLVRGQSDRTLAPSVRPRCGDRSPHVPGRRGAGASIAKLASEYADLGPNVGKAKEVSGLREQIEQLTAMSADPDPDIRAKAGDELVEVKRRLPDIERECLRASV